MDVEKHPLADDTDAWTQVIDDCRATAEEYRERGWSVAMPVPGDAVPVPAPGDSADDKVGLDVLVSGDEFDRLTTLVDVGEFDEFESLRAYQNGIVYLTVVFQATAHEAALCLPLYYRVAEANRMLDRVRAGDAMRTYVHPLSGDNRIEFDHEDPTPLFPPENEVNVQSDS